MLLPLALERPYTYGAHQALAAGTLVEVPLGPRHVVGCVWDSAVDEIEAGRLRFVRGVIDAPPLPTGLRQLISWVARWTMAPLGMVLRLALRAHEAGEKTASPPKLLRWTGVEPAKTTAARQRVMSLLSDRLARRKADIAGETGVSGAVIEALVKAGVLESIIAPRLPLPLPQADFMTPHFNEAQSLAASALRDMVAARRFSTTLLHGVTGSGKTEVYFEAIAATLRQGRQALVLVPEIALTGQFLDRFAGRFGARPIEWHSEVPAAQRPRLWRAAASGEAQVVVGARSALFLPFCALGLIVVDEEHDPAFKQEDGVAYHARDMAVVRGRIEHIPVVLASATPSLETYVNADRGRYHRIALAQRYGARALPHLKAIDLRRDPPAKGRWLSPVLVEALAGRLARGEQALLFLNRRGYAPLTLCRACGYRFGCPSCSAWLVDHRFRRELQCHHCGYAQPVPSACPSCGVADKLVGVGPGVERVAEELAERFPAARLSILSSDMAGGLARLKSEIGAIERGEVDLIIGTQLVAKGHHFPGLTLVGIIDADIGLASGDPRAAERTFQLLHQVVGRAGRGEIAGEALVQTHAPEHPVMAALLTGDADLFLQREAEQRQLAGLPPFGRLASLLISGPDSAAARAHARALARAAPPDGAVRVLGPAEAPLALLRGRHRFRLLVKAPRAYDLQNYIQSWLAAAPKPSGRLRVSVDIDPQSFL